MRASDWAAQSQKKIEKKRRTQATQQTSSPNFLRYQANFRADIADRNYPYGTLKLIADTDRISPVYNPYGKSVGRWCVFTENGWELDNG